MLVDHKWKHCCILIFFTCVHLFHGMTNGIFSSSSSSSPLFVYLFYGMTNGIFVSLFNFVSLFMFLLYLILCI